MLSEHRKKLIEAALPLPEIKAFQPYIDKLDAADADVLELAATYGMFRSMGSNRKEAVARLRRKKGSKCGGGKQAAQMLLLELGLPDKKLLQAKLQEYYEHAQEQARPLVDRKTKPRGCRK